MSGADRVIVLVDMDCFYCQVEEKLNPDLKGKPVAVVQYNQWKGGGLIAVNYEARARGVSRHMRGDAAKAACPEIQLVSVPTVREKADISRYRRAGKEVATVLQTFTPVFERASIDEAYLDITNVVCDRLDSFSSITPKMLQNTHVVGFETVKEYLEELKTDEYLNDSNVKLLIGGQIVEEMRAAVFEKTGYRCSAGVAHNKILAKLCAGLHKPNKQTILPHESVGKFYETISINKIRSLGGKFGNNVMHTLNVEMMADLVKYTEKELEHHFDKKTANWLYYIARGINYEPVTVRLVAKSIGCCKKFPGPDALVTDKAVRHWINLLSLEIVERIETDVAENNRKPKQLVVNYAQQMNRKQISNSRSQPLTAITQERIALEAYEVVKTNCAKKDGTYRITFLGLNAGKFEDIKSEPGITKFFKNCPKTGAVGLSNCTNSIKDVDELHQLSVSKLIDKEETNANSVICDDEHKMTKCNESDDSEAELEAINCSVNESLSNTPKSSFFRKFLGQTNGPKRDFNTSISLTQQNEDDSSEEINAVNSENSEIEKPLVENSNNDLTETNSNNTKHAQSSNGLENCKQFISDDNKELCTHCNKLIPVEKITSHLDYHYALSIVREEAHLYKTDKSAIHVPGEGNKGEKVNQSMHKTSAKSHGHSRKRKLQMASAQTALMKDFFHKEGRADNILNETNSKVCSDCNKRIKLDELASHLDYHVAKRIQLEINMSNTVKVSHQIKNDSNGSKKNKFASKGANKLKNRDESQSSTVTLKSFFKPV